MDFNQKIRAPLLSEIRLGNQFQAIEHQPLLVIRSRSDDSIFLNQRITRVPRLRNLRDIQLHRFAGVRPKLVFYTLGDVRNVVAAKQEAGVPAVKNNHATIFSRTPKSCVNSNDESGGKNAKQSDTKSKKCEFVASRAAHGAPVDFFLPSIVALLEAEREPTPDKRGNRKSRLQYGVTAKGRFQVGDKVKVVGMSPVTFPPGVKDELGTEKLFKSMLGKVYTVR